MTGDIERALITENLMLKETIWLLKQGECWCEVGIGNPMVREHSLGCQRAQAVCAYRPMSDIGQTPKRNGA